MKLMTKPNTQFRSFALIYNEKWYINRSLWLKKYDEVHTVIFDDIKDLHHNDIDSYLWSYTDNSASILAQELLRFKVFNFPDDVNYIILQHAGRCPTMLPAEGSVFDYPLLHDCINQQHYVLLMQLLEDKYHSKFINHPRYIDRYGLTFLEKAYLYYYETNDKLFNDILGKYLSDRHFNYYKSLSICNNNISKLIKYRFTYKSHKSQISYPNDNVNDFQYKYPVTQNTRPNTYFTHKNYSDLVLDDDGSDICFDCCVNKCRCNRYCECLKCCNRYCFIL